VKCSKHNVEMDVPSDCHVCHGDGVIEVDDPWMELHTKTCYACKGSGAGLEDCEFCLEESRDDYNA